MADIKIETQYVVYCVEIGLEFQCSLAVDHDRYDYCYLERWKFSDDRFMKTQDGSAEAATSMVKAWAVLKDNELVELKPIGPEDSEYFVTDLFLDLVGTEG